MKQKKKLYIISHIGHISDWLARLTPEEKADLYKGIGYDQNANIAKLPKEASMRGFNVLLKCIHNSIHKHVSRGQNYFNIALVLQYQ